MTDSRVGPGSGPAAMARPTERKPRAAARRRATLLLVWAACSRALLVAGVSLIGSGEQMRPRPTARGDRVARSPPATDAPAARRWSSSRAPSRSSRRRCRSSQPVRRADRADRSPRRAGAPGAIGRPRQGPDSQAAARSDADAAARPRRQPPRPGAAAKPVAPGLAGARRRRRLRAGVVRIGAFGSRARPRRAGGRSSAAIPGMQAPEGGGRAGASRCATAGPITGCSSGTTSQAHSEVLCQRMRMIAQELRRRRLAARGGQTGRGG